MSGQDITVCIVKSTVRKETISTNEIAKAHGIGELPSGGKQIIDSYDQVAGIFNKIALNKKWN